MNWRFSLSYKILAVFLSLTLITLVLGITVLGSMLQLGRLNDQLRQIHSFEMQLNLLESRQLGLTPGSAEASREEFVGQIDQVREMVALLGREFNPAEADFYRRLGLVEELLGHYRQAAEELIAAYQREQAFRQEAPALRLALFQELAARLPEWGEDSARGINFLALQSQALIQRDPTAIGGMRRISRELGQRRQDPALLASLNTLLAKSENNYLDYLEGYDRRLYLRETQEHLLLFARRTSEELIGATGAIQRQLFWLAAGVAVLAILVTLGLWFVSSRYANRFLLSQRQAITAIEQGRYDYPLPPVSHDELGELSLFMKRMAERLRRSTHRLRRSEKKYRTLIETTATGFVILDPKGVVLDANELYLQLTGHGDKKQVIGHHPLEWTAPADHQATRAALDRCVREGMVRNLMVEYGSTEDQRRPVEINAALVETEEGAMIMALCRDISERLRAEEALAAERERLAVTLRSIGDGVISTDTEGRVTFINRVAEELTGWRQHEAAGLPLCQVFPIINEKTRQPCENPVDKVLASGQIVGLANHTALIARDGRERSIADSGAPIRDRNSRVIGVVLVFRDVTEQYRMEDELFKAKKLEAVGVLAGGIAHDFNNLLTAIQGNLALIGLTLPPEEDKIRPLVQGAEKASTRASGLTRQLLTFAKGGSPVRKTADMVVVIKDSAEFVLRGSSCACRYDFAADLWPVEIDSGQISQVVQNIVINAGQAMPAGGVIAVRGHNVPAGDPALPLQLRLAGNCYIRIDISDHGAGIADDQLERVFDPYFTTKEKGNGLGLAISHSIINRHSGHIGASSVPGQGATFTFFLPASAGRPAAVAGDWTQSLPLPGGHVLVMDDEEIIRGMLTMMLEQQGFAVTAVADGQQAVECYGRALAQGAPFAVAILDLTIPGGMGGKEAARRLLEIDPAARLIVSSGYSNDSIMADFTGYGFRAAVVKPYSLQELLEALGRVLVTGGKEGKGPGGA
ncbi:PAS domain S-box protein [Desulfurivibrio sp. D14AmB]|uniref:PAS domain S-box protein n=1 Tax=Desulfurivibrio sp. D14AmB TaxID=3374370 RepID=UPI00376EC3C7